MDRSFPVPRPSGPDTPTAQPDILCFSHLRWHFVTQRPQHLMRRAARDHRVFYWEEPLWHEQGELPSLANGDPGYTLETVREGPCLWILRPHLTRGADADAVQQALLLDLLRDFKIARILRWFYTPMALRFARGIGSEAVVYDCMDELSGFVGAPPELSEREQELFSAADVVFTGGISLFEEKQKQHGNVHAFPSSIELEHFMTAQTESLPDPEEMAGIPHPRAGFYGVLDERFDTQLLSDVATLRPEVQFVLLGPVVKIDPAILPQRKNIHYLGSKSYQDLPAHLRSWDVALMPFALNDATRFISPTKTPEYLAGGKTVVSTPIRDVVRSYGDLGLVAIAADAEEFAEAIDAALLPQSESWRGAVAQKLSQSSWDSTWDAMQREIDRVRETKRAQQRPLLRDLATPFRTGSTARSSASPALSRSHPYDRGAERFDYLVVGAGFAGSVLAERLANQLDKRVLLIDKRDHIAGNAYDFENEDGILVHQYGPHIFHTNSDEVVKYLSRFTAWRPYEHRVLASVDGQLLPVPINLDTINQLYGLSLDAEGMQAFLASRTETPAEIRTSEDIVVSRVGRDLYEKFFKNYTRKQWGLDPSQLDASVAGRIPVRFNHDDRYFADNFQAMPLHGYTRMFERMLDHPRITIRTGVLYQDVIRSYPNAKVVFTGPIDEFYDFRFGPLPYRSLEFRHETHACEVYQSAPVVNYPNEHAYTRVTEFKYLTGQRNGKTSIVYEYPRSEGDPYYPIPRPENAVLLTRYRELAKRDSSVHFCGRLANYQYFNMDQVVAQALTVFREIAKHEANLPVPVVRVGSSAVKTLRELA